MRKSPAGFVGGSNIIGSLHVLPWFLAVLIMVSVLSIFGSDNYHSRRKWRLRDEPMGNFTTKVPRPFLYSRYDSVILAITVLPLQ